MPLSLSDLHHLEAAEGWLDRKMYADCFDELERIDYNNRGDGRELGLRWKLYNADGQHVPAANLALGIQRRFPNDPAGYVWRAVSLTKLGCTDEAYEDLEAVAGKFDGIGMVPYVLAVLAAQLQRMEVARYWLVRAFATPDGKQLKLLALEERELDGFWRKIRRFSLFRRGTRAYQPVVKRAKRSFLRSVLARRRPRCVHWRFSATR